MKTIYFVRHGESEANVASLGSGSEFDTPLTDNGRAQAKKAGKDLKHKQIQLIICSPLSRTVDTATIIAKEMGYDPKKIITSPYFIERAYGVYSHKPDKIYLADALADTLHESAETAEVMHARISKGLDWLKNLKEDRILVVSHGGVSRILRIIHQELPFTEMYRIDRFPNGAIYEFSL
ncbi:histidine phosphatase family protein [Candidatus Saccharibacteria bacterium]|nr:histidine phosphatase family protein [Candidatus Saccharibacteria bacterium]